MMKTKLTCILLRPWIAVLCGSMMLAANLHADVIVNASTLNGSFENPTGVTSPSATVDNWQFGFNSGALQRVEDNSTDGDWSLVIGRQNNNDGAGILGAYQNTGYQVTGADEYTLSFDWTGAYQWDTAYRLNWRLFTTDDNTPGGAQTNIASGFVDNKPANINNYSTANVLINGGTVTAPSIGQQLHVEFYASNLGSSTLGHFARMDNVEVAVIPEPGALLLMGIALGSVLLFRRRK